MPTYFYKKYFSVFFVKIKKRRTFAPGEMAERSNAAVLKTVVPKGPGVRIPLSPLAYLIIRYSKI